jgi:hypothetical protein
MKITDGGSNGYVKPGQRCAIMQYTDRTVFMQITPCQGSDFDQQRELTIVVITLWQDI